VEWLETAKSWTREVKRDVVALYLAARDPRTPLVAKLAAAAVAAYALSPIDLIPDFIPVLGYLDDLVVVPLGILLVVSLIPPELMAEFRHEATQRCTLPAHWGRHRPVGDRCSSGRLVVLSPGVGLRGKRGAAD
jgi:uncharacterized membrane protein YkvA (DUF1232 family)